MPKLPKGERQDVVTYAVWDVTRGRRGSGITKEAAAVALAERLAEDEAHHGPFTIERTTYASFTHREVIRTVGGE